MKHFLTAMAGVLLISCSGLNVGHVVPIRPATLDQASVERVDPHGNGSQVARFLDAHASKRTAGLCQERCTAMDLNEVPGEPDIDMFVAQVRAAIPDVVPRVDAIAQEIYGDVPEASGDWIFAFQIATKEAVRTNDMPLVKEHLALMESHHLTGSASVKNCIEGEYVQHLLAGLTSVEKSRVWPMLPGTFQRFYVAVCGEPGSVRFENA